MTTKADFYDGRGPAANADPETVCTVVCGRSLLGASDPFAYAAVIDLLDVWVEQDLGHGYHPRDGWPWLWPDSGETDWVFAFDHGRVWIATGGAWRAR